MSTDDARRRELAAFLRARRTQVDREALGLPAETSRRAQGLRREEVAALSGVSITWYTWLEQARPTNPSRQVLEALGRAMRLTEPERSYLVSLGGYVTTPAAPADGPTNLGSLLDALGASPAFALAPDWTITAWNAAYRALYPRVATVPVRNRNLLWAVYADPFVRELLPDWEVTSSRFLAEFRAEAGPRLGEADRMEIVERLLERSETFRANWARHDIEGFASRHRSFRTSVGALEFEQHRLVPADQREVHVVVYTAADAVTSRRMARLLRG